MKCMSTDIIIRGAREHNLKNIDIRIPRNSLTVITGLSGSGKSSLAFDTLYAEGQRRYVESLSAYARQFLGQLQKPEVEQIEGLSPAIAIEQRSAGNNPRSVVATATEIHDYLRLLYGNIGQAHCPKCGRPVERQSAEQIVDRLIRLEEGTRMTLMAPLAKGRKGGHLDLFESLRREGFARVRVNGTLYPLDDLPKLDRRRAHTIEVVVDRLVAGQGNRTRLTDSVELALKRGDGLAIVLCQDAANHETEIVCSERNACTACSLSFEELQPRSFSFNSPHGACPACAGLGTQLIFDEDLVVPDKSLSLADGAVQAWRRGGRRMILYYRHLLKAVAAYYDIDMDLPYERLPESFRRVLMHGTGEEPIELRYWMRGATRTYRKPFEGVLPSLQRRYHETEIDDVRERLQQYMTRRRCEVCNGGRLRPEARACTVGGRTIVEVMGMTIRDADRFMATLKPSPQEIDIVGEVLKEIRRRLRFLVDVGLDYLTLDRESGTLSGGEMQRIRLATQIGSGLVGVLYVLDEPTIGLHARDNERLIAMLRKLQRRGNTVVVVEHDEAMIREADYVIDLGPRAGRHGGEVIYQGPPAKLETVERSLTAAYLTGRERIGATGRRQSPGELWLTVKGASEHNLRDLDVSIPLGCFVCVTGVSGSGKSTLVDEILRKHLSRVFFRAKDRPGTFREITGVEHLDKVIEIDQSPIGRTPRSNPATYTGAFTPLRALYAATPAAKMRGYGPGRFSFNVKGGRCEACRGDGLLRMEMNFLPDVYVTCEQCGGRRYNRETLQIKYGGIDISEALALTVEEALERFQAVPALERKLRMLSDVGLGYLQLGQAATTLSGGEAQRIKLAAELSRKSTGRTLFLLDEPTTGLHFADVHKLLDVLIKLRDAGNSVLVIEHNLDVIRCSDYIIDLGPGGGDAGGRLVAAGTPEAIAACKESHTGRFLRYMPPCDNETAAL